MTTCRIQLSSYSSENEVEVVGRFLNEKDFVDHPYVLREDYLSFWKIHPIFNGEIRRLPQAKNKLPIVSFSNYSLANNNRRILSRLL